MIAFLAAGIALIAAYTLILLVEDAIPAWYRRWQRNRAIRQARQTVVTPWPKSNVLRLDERRGG